MQWLLSVHTFGVTESRSWGLQIQESKQPHQLRHEARTFRP